MIEIGSTLIAVNRKLVKNKIFATEFWPLPFIKNISIVWDIVKNIGNYYKLREMIRNSGIQITRYYVWLNNIWKYIIHKSVRMVGCKIKGINELESRESKNSFVWLCSWKFTKLTLKSPSKKIDFCP